MSGGIIKAANINVQGSQEILCANVAHCPLSTAHFKHHSDQYIVFAQNQANTIINDAKKEAEDIIAKAIEEREVIINKAHEDAKSVADSIIKEAMKNSSASLNNARPSVEKMANKSAINTSYDVATDEGSAVVSSTIAEVNKDNYDASEAPFIDYQERFVSELGQIRVATTSSLEDIIKRLSKLKLNIERGNIVKLLSMIREMDEFTTLLVDEKMQNQLRMLRKRMMKVFVSIGVSEIIPKTNEEFDPIRHECQEEIVGYNFKVSRVILSGFEMNEDVLLRAVIEPLGLRKKK